MVKLKSPNLKQTGYEFDEIINLPDLDPKLLQALTYLIGYSDDTERFELLAVDSDRRLLVSSGSIKTDDGNISRPSIDNTADVILNANPDRKKMIIQNVGTVTVYLGFTNTVTTATGFPLPVNAVWEDENWIGALYGITASIANELSVIEMS